jgi:hypothetical protein
MLGPFVVLGPLVVLGPFVVVSVLVFLAAPLVSTGTRVYVG